MRWTALFADLEAEADALAAAELDVEVRDRTRREAALVRLQDRLTPAEGAPIRLRVTGAGAVDGTLLHCGPDWLLVAAPGGRELLVSIGAVLAVSGVGRRTAAPGSEGRVGSRLDLAYALRGLARTRSEVRVVLREGTVINGSLDRVGADYVEMAEHAAGEPRRAGAVQAVTLVPHSALAVLSSLGG